MRRRDVKQVSAEQVLAGADWGKMYLFTRVDEGLEQCEACLAFGKAPHAPAFGPFTVAMFSGKLQVDLLSPGDIAAVRVTPVSSKYPLLRPVRTKNPQGARDTFCNSWVGVFGPTMCIQMDEGGERKHESRTKLRSGRRIKKLLQGVGAHPWVLQRRNGLARGNYNRLKDDHRASGKQTLAEVQWCLHTHLGREFSAYRAVFGSDPVDHYGWGGKDEDLTLAQDTSLSGQIARQ